MRAALAPAHSNMPVKASPVGAPLKARVDLAAFGESKISGQKRARTSPCPEQGPAFPVVAPGVVRSAVTVGAATQQSLITGRPRTKSSASLLPAASISNGAGANPARPRVRTKSVTSPAGYLPTASAVNSPGKVRRPLSRPASPSRLPPVPPLPSGSNSTPTSNYGAPRIRAASPATPIARANTGPSSETSTSRNFFTASLSNVTAKHVFPSPSGSDSGRPQTTPTTLTTHTVNGKDRPMFPVKAKITSEISQAPRSPTLTVDGRPPLIRSGNTSSANSTPLRSPTIPNSPKMASPMSPIPPASASMPGHRRQHSASSTSNTSAVRHRSNSKSSSITSNADGWFENAREVERAKEREREARERRKILDLEITNASLSALNATLERTKLKQGAELRDLRKKLRDGGSLHLSLAAGNADSTELPSSAEDDAEKSWSMILDEDLQFKEIARCLESLLSRGMAAVATEWQISTEIKQGAKVLMPAFDHDLAASPLSTAGSLDHGGSLTARSISPMPLTPRGLGLHPFDGSNGSDSLSASQTDANSSFDLGASHSTQSSEAEAWTSGIVSPTSAARARMPSIEDARQTISASPRMYGIAPKSR